MLWRWHLTHKLAKLIRWCHYLYQGVFQIWEKSIQEYWVIMFTRLQWAASKWKHNNILIIRNGGYIISKIVFLPPQLHVLLTAMKCCHWIYGIIEWHSSMFDIGHQQKPMIAGTDWHDDSFYVLEFLLWKTKGLTFIRRSTEHAIEHCKYAAPHLTLTTTPHLALKITNMKVLSSHVSREHSRVRSRPKIHLY